MSSRRGTSPTASTWSWPRSSWPRGPVHRSMSVGIGRCQRHILLQVDAFTSWPWFHLGWLCFLLWFSFCLETQCNFPQHARFTMSQSQQEPLRNLNDLFNLYFYIHYITGNNVIRFADPIHFSVNIQRTINCADLPGSGGGAGGIRDRFGSRSSRSFMTWLVLFALFLLFFSSSRA